MGRGLRWLARQSEAAIFGGKATRLPLLIVVAGALLGYRIAKAGAGGTLYTKALSEGERISLSLLKPEEALRYRRKR